MTLRLTSTALAGLPPAITWVSWTLKFLPSMRIVDSSPSWGGRPCQASSDGRSWPPCEQKIRESLLSSVYGTLTTSRWVGIMLLSWLSRSSAI